MRNLLSPRDVKNAKIIIQTPRRIGDEIIDIVEAILAIEAIIKVVSIYSARNLA